MAKKNSETENLHNKMKLIDEMVIDLSETKIFLTKTVTDNVIGSSDACGSDKCKEESVSPSINDLEKMSEEVKKLKTATLMKGKSHLSSDSAMESVPGRLINLEVEMNNIKSIIDDIQTDEEKKEGEITELKNGLEILKHTVDKIKEEQDTDEPDSKRRRTEDIQIDAAENDIPTMKEEINHLKIVAENLKSQLQIVNVPIIYGLKEKITRACKTRKWDGCKKHLERYLCKNTTEYTQFQKIKNEKNHLPLIAAEQGCVELMKVLLVNGLPVNQVYSGYKNMTTLQYAASCGQRDLADFLINQGAGISIGNYSDWTPLHYAASSGHADVVSLLIERGVDVNEKCKSGLTALYWAVRGNHLSVVKCLVDAGCDKTGALEVAVKEGELSARACGSDDTEKAILELLSE